MKFKLALLLSALVMSLAAQEKSTITGSPIVLVYANYHAGFGENNDLSGFELTRAYLGYQFQLTSNLSGKAVIDAAVPPAETYMLSQKKDIYLKNAMLSWKDKGFTINGGLTSLLEFGLQEKFWRHRYIAPTFQDLYKMGPSADLGVTAEYRFDRWIAADVSFTNGEGYKNLNMDNKYRTGLGITLNPLKELTLRLYGDTYKQSLTDQTQYTFAAFAGYKCKFISLGAEYNYQENSQFTKDLDYFGYSVYTVVPVAKKWNLVGRYDSVDSKDGDNKPWIKFTGDFLIAGVEYIPMKNLRFTLDYQYVKNFDTKLLIHSTFNTAYMNVEFLW